MTNNPNQPRPNDAVLGGQSLPPLNSPVLGGWEGVKQRLASNSDEIRIAALEDVLKYGQLGKDLVLQIVKAETGFVQCAAYDLLSRSVDEIEKQQLQKYLPTEAKLAQLEVESLGEAVNKSVKRALDARAIGALANSCESDEYETVLSGLDSYSDEDSYLMGVIRPSWNVEKDRG